MDAWENTKDSVYSEILRYKADIAALDTLTHSLGGLQETMAEHIDMKSRILITLIGTSLTQVAGMRQQLRPVQDFHKEVQERVSIHHPVKLVVYVNKNEFLRSREHCMSVMAELKPVLQKIHEHLMVWHAQEFGRFNVVEDHPTGERDWSNTWKFLEGMIWDNYISSYTTLMGQ